MKKIAICFFAICCMVLLTNAANAQCYGGGHGHYYSGHHYSGHLGGGYGGYGGGHVHGVSVGYNSYPSYYNSASFYPVRVNYNSGFSPYYSSYGGVYRGIGPIHHHHGGGHGHSGHGHGGLSVGFRF